MNTRKATRRTLVGVAIFCSLVLTTCSTVGESQPPGGTVHFLSPPEMITDLVFVRDMLVEVHPAFAAGASAEFAETFTAIRERVAKPLSHSEFICAVNSLLRPLGDAHTAVRFPQELLVADLPLVWLDSGLFAYDDFGPGSSSAGIEAGDQIVAIAGRPLEVISDLLGNTFLVTESHDDLRAVGLPFIFSGALLSALGVGLSQSAVPVSVLRDGVVKNISFRRFDQDHGRQYYSAQPAVYSIPGHEEWRFPRLTGALSAPQVRTLSAEGVVYMRFDQCRPNEEYLRALDRVCAAVEQNLASAIVIDLRYNAGGDSRVVQEFLRCVGVAQYRSFSRTTRYSQHAADQRGYERTTGIETVESPVIQLQPPDSGEAGLEAEIYVLVSNHTHSSANWFATIVQENEVGTIVGEPTGNPAGHFGDVLLFETPITHLQFSVSHKHFSPPSGDPADYVRTLAPDVIVETTIEDVLGGFDRQLAYVIDRHRRSLAAPDR